MQADKVCLIETKNRGTESDLESEGGKAAETQRHSAVREPALQAVG